MQERQDSVRSEGCLKWGLATIVIVSAVLLGPGIVKRDEEIRAARKLEEKEIEGYRYEVRVPKFVQVPDTWVNPPMQPSYRIPGYLATVETTFLTSTKPETEDQDGQMNLVLTKAVRYDPRNNTILERLPLYEIINPVNIAIIYRFPQDKNP